jgi:hypothetical protein
MRPEARKFEYYGDGNLWNYRDIRFALSTLITQNRALQQAGATRFQLLGNV